MIKRFTTDNGSNEDVCLVDNFTGKEYESNFTDIVSLMNELDEKWIDELNLRETYQQETFRLEYENKELKKRVDDKQVAVEVETCKLMEKIVDLIDRRISHYSHKPVGASISNPANPQFDEDVDRYARLSELQELKTELKRL